MKYSFRNLGRQTLEKLIRVAGLGFLFSFLIFWQIVSMSGLIPTTVFPSALNVLGSLFKITVNGTISSATLATLERLFAGYLVAAFIGVIIGMGMGLSPGIDEIANPLVQFLRPMPSVILVPLAILYFGLGSSMIISVIIYACIWPILINTADGVKSIDPTLLDTAELFHIHGLSKIRKVILPSSAPLIFSGLRVSLGVAWIVSITAEIISTATTNGIGGMIFLDLNTGKLSEVYAAILATAAIAYCMMALFLALQKRIIPWYEKSKGR
ncbi:MAG: ABC transporter permease [Thaumarchaeota archaeon]|nr:ABC transporter permease [Nitrososphaerota archaeon]